MDTRGWLIVLVTIVAMFLVIIFGAIARRRGYLTHESTRLLSRFFVDFVFPAMVLTSLLRTINPHRLSESLLFPFLGIVILLGGLAVGWAVAPLCCRREQRPTFVFLVFLANWIFIPLPIAQQLYGDDGVRAVLLINVGAQVMLWTVGVWTLRQGKLNWSTLRNLATNPGMLATVAGIALALLWPAARTVEATPLAHLSLLAIPGKMLVYALVLLGSLTIPLSLVITGSQLGGLPTAHLAPTRAVYGVVAARLLLAPLLSIALLWGLHHAGLHIAAHDRMVAYLIACMPIAVNSSIFAEVYDGDTRLAACGIFYSTLLSIVSVPVLFFAMQALHL